MQNTLSRGNSQIPVTLEIMVRHVKVSKVFQILKQTGVCVSVCVFVFMCHSVCVSERQRVCVWICVYVYVCERDIDRDRESACVWESLCLCVWVRESKREKSKVSERNSNVIIFRYKISTIPFQSKVTSSNSMRGQWRKAGMNELKTRISPMMH